MDCPRLVSCTENFEHSLAEKFEKWGKFVGRRPCTVILTSLIIALFISVGVINIRSETDSHALYVPQNLWPYKTKQKYDKTWGKREALPRNIRYIVTPKDKNVQNIYNHKYLLQLKIIHETLINITVKHKGIQYGFKDICVLNDANNCQIRSVLQYYQFNIEKNDTLNESFVLKNISYPSEFSTYSLSFEAIPLIMGAPVNVTSKSFVFSTPALFSWYTQDEDTYTTRLVDKYEKKFLRKFDKYVKNNNLDLDITYRASISARTELLRALVSDTGNFLMSFGLLALFSCLVLIRLTKSDNRCCKYKIDSLHNRGPLALLGIVSSILAVTTSFGLVGGIFNVPFNGVVSISPFLLVGLGVDDMFVLIRAYELTPKTLSIEQRIGITMKRGGVSILFTSITDLLAFCVGSSSSFGAIRAFCLYTGLGIFLDFLFQISFFLGFMVYHSRQQNIGKYSIKKICCPNNDINKLYKFYENDMATKDEMNIKTTIELHTLEKDKNNEKTTNKDGENDNTTKPSRHRHTRTLSSFRIKRQQSSVIDSKETSPFMEYFGSVILNNGTTKGLVFIIEILFIVLAIIGLSTLGPDQELEDLVLKDSYLLPYWKNLDKYFSSTGPLISFNIEKKYIDYSKLHIKNVISNMSYEALLLEKCFVPGLGQSWIDEYYNYINSNNSLKYLFDNETIFNKYLVEKFITQNDYIALKDDLWIENVTDKYGNITTYRIKRSRIHIRFVSTGTNTKILSRCLPDIKSIMNRYHKELKVYAYEPTGRFNQASTDLVTYKYTIVNLVYAIMAAAFFTLVLIPYPLVSIYVMITVTQILLCVLGFMSLWGLPINVTTMICSVMAVGFSVDNSAHFSHSYIVTPIQIKKTPYKERLERVIFALNAVGLPILYGDMSTMLAIVPLMLSASEIFKAFFKVITLVMIFGIWHGLVYLPVLFSVIGPTGNFAKTIENYSKTKPKLDPDEYQMDGQEKHENVCKLCISICLCKTQ